MNKELILSNLREIIAASNGQNTYQGYLAQVTIDHIEEAVDDYFSMREVEKVKPK